VARAILEQAAADERIGARLQGEAERVEGVADVDVDGVQQVAVAGVGADEQRQRGRLVGRLALHVGGAGPELDVRVISCTTDPNRLTRSSGVRM
jgi:hypothetical protein